MSAIANLTPGDFAQVMRQSQFSAIETQLDLARNLETACALKKSGANQPIGFVQ